jgi:hypothetical protein
MPPEECWSFVEASSVSRSSGMSPRGTHLPSSATHDGGHSHATDRGLSPPRARFSRFIHSNAEDIAR